MAERQGKRERQREREGKRGKERERERREGGRTGREREDNIKLAGFLVWRLGLAPSWMAEYAYTRSERTNERGTEGDAPELLACWGLRIGDLVG